MPTLDLLLSVPLSSSWLLFLLTGLSLSLGWGIRGNFGHESGAAMPGALASMAVVLCAGRPDWWPLVASFALFGALGWSFGGSISYMQVIGYTHSPHSRTVLYGFANTFVIGFLWASLGGAGTALPAFVAPSDMGLYFVPILAVFLSWCLKDLVEDRFFKTPSDKRHESRLYWYDSDWLAAVTAIIAGAGVAALKGRLDPGTSLVLCLSVGWFAAFLILVNLFKLRMTPPRGDNWAGAVGMVVGLLLWCHFYHQPGIALAAWVCGLTGGMGYFLAQLIKLALIKTGRQANWHSVLEQTQGLFHGLGLALAMAWVARIAPKMPSGSHAPQWTVVFSVFFVLVVITYLNHRKAVATWVEAVECLPERFYGLLASGYLKGPGFVGWFELMYSLIGIAVLILSVAHLRHPLPLIPENPLGQAQLLYTVFLWWIVVFNFERALVRFTPTRIVTEGAITANAVLCSMLALLAPVGIAVTEVLNTLDPGRITRIILVSGTLKAAVLILLCWQVKRWMWGDVHAPGAGLHIRFGPDSNASKAKPKKGDLHP